MAWEKGNRTIDYLYDDNGSVTQKTTTEGSLTVEVIDYAYNLRGRLESVTATPYSGGAPTTPVVTTQYNYNPQGIRVEKTVDSVVTKYLIDPYNHTGYAQVLEETTGSTTITYTIGDDVIAQYNSTDGTEYLLYDGHGSTRQLADDAGAIVTGQNFSYDAYGVMLSDGSGADAAANAGTNLLYAGEQYDSSASMYYNRARYYNPSIGRFNRTDPYAGSPQDPQSLHKYLYCHANPVNGIDPSGMMISLLSVTITSAIIGALIGGTIGGIDSVLGGGSFWSGFGWGALFGGLAGAAAVFLPMTLLVKAILGGLIIATTAIGAISSFMNGHYLQAFFRIIVGLVSFGILVKAPRGPSLRARVGYVKSLENLGFTAAEAKAIAFGKPIATCISNPGERDTVVLSQFVNGRLRVGIWSVENTSGSGARSILAFRTFAYNMARALGVNKVDMFGAAVVNSEVEAMLIRQGFQPQTWIMTISGFEGLQEIPVYVKTVSVP